MEQTIEKNCSIDQNSKIYIYDGGHLLNSPDATE